jgi:peptidoglycan/LPS O-acetylase OafA/YrhL
MGNRIQELDVLRILAMLFVITFHFGREYTAAGLPCFNLLYKTVNYEFGNLAVTIFIAISGGILYKKHGVIGKSNGSLKDFYLRRARSIYPPFWILSLYIPLTMIRHLLSNGNPFFLVNPFSLLFTLVGFDGYVKCFGITSYVFCGDWFVGAIVLLYLLYPLLARCYSKRPVLTLLVLTLLYGLQFLIPAKYDELFSGLPATLALKFCIGFLLVQNLERLKDWRIALTGALLFLGLSFVDIPGRFKADLLGTIAAYALFAVAFYIAPHVLQFKAMSKSIQILVPLSYCVFLVQHVGIVWVQTAFIKIFDKMHWDFTEWKNLALLACTTVAITLAAWILKRISDWVTERVLKFLS